MAFVRTCFQSAARRRYGVETRFEMRMYHLYIPLSQPFSPCLALAREALNRLLAQFGVAAQPLRHQVDEGPGFGRGQSAFLMQDVDGLAGVVVLGQHLLQLAGGQ